LGNPNGSNPVFQGLDNAFGRFDSQVCLDKQGFNFIPGVWRDLTDAEQVSDTSEGGLARFGKAFSPLVENAVHGRGL
jgi:hypothetical protein